MGRRLWSFVAALAAFAPPAGGAVGPWAETEQSAVRLVSRWSVAAPGGDAGLGLEFRLAPGWHVYWRNPGDAGYPPEIRLAAGPLATPEILYPAPHRFDLPGGLVSYGYEGEVVYPLAAAWQPDADGVAELGIDLDYLVCAEQCIPYRASLTLEQPLAAETVVDAEPAAAVDRWRERLPRPIESLPGGGATAVLHRATGPELDLELAPRADALTVREPDLFFAPHPLVALERPAYRAADGTFVVHLRPIDETKPLPEQLAFAWTATGYELAGQPVAVAGELVLARPTAAAALAAPMRWALAVALLAAVAFAVHRWGRRDTGGAD